MNREILNERFFPASKRTVAGKKHFHRVLISGVITLLAPAPPSGWRAHNHTQFKNWGENVQQN